MRNACIQIAYGTESEILFELLGHNAFFKYESEPEAQVDAFLKEIFKAHSVPVVKEEEFIIYITGLTSHEFRAFLRAYHILKYVR